METKPTEEAAPEAAPAKIKAMRRQPCPCGSGKVFKNCHEGDPGYEVATTADEAAKVAPTAPAGQGKGPMHPSAKIQAKTFNQASRDTGVGRRRKV